MKLADLSLINFPALFNSDSSLTNSTFVNSVDSTFITSIDPTLITAPTPPALHTPDPLDMTSSAAVSLGGGYQLHPVNAYHPEAGGYSDYPGQKAGEYYPVHQKGMEYQVQNEMFPSAQQSQLYDVFYVYERPDNVRKGTLGVLGVFSCLALKS